MERRYFITRNGVAATLVDAKLHSEIKEALEGKADTLTTQRLLRDEMIGVDRREPMKHDHNALALNGVLDQVRSVVTRLQERAEPYAPQMAMATTLAPPGFVGARGRRLTGAGLPWATCG